MPQATGRLILPAPTLKYGASVGEVSFSRTQGTTARRCLLGACLAVFSVVVALTWTNHKGQRTASVLVQQASLGAPLIRQLSGFPEHKSKVNLRTPLPRVHQKEARQTGPTPAKAMPESAENAGSALAGAFVATGLAQEISRFTPVDAATYATHPSSTVVGVVAAVSLVAAAVAYLFRNPSPPSGPAFALAGVGVVEASEVTTTDRDPLVTHLKVSGDSSRTVFNQRISMPKPGPRQRRPSPSDDEPIRTRGFIRTSITLQEVQELVRELVEITVATGPAAPSRFFSATRAVTETGIELLRDPQAAAQSPAKVLRKLFERLGTTYIKLGQFIASTPSVFPEEFVVEFQNLLDQTSPIDYEVIKETIEEDLGMRIDEVYEYVDPVPLASASVAQVHVARLRGNKKEVVIKVLKPNVKDILQADLSFLYAGAKILEFLSPQLSASGIVNILADIRASMMEEVNFTKEANNIKEFTRYLDATGNDMVVAPYIYSGFSGERVMTMERFKGVPLTDMAKVRRTTTLPPEQVLLNALNTWLGSVFLAESFHADVHAGNLLVMPSGKVAFIDFGIVGRISPITFKSVSAFLTSLTTRDYNQMAKALVTMGATQDDQTIADGKKVTIDIFEFSRDLENFFEELYAIDRDLVVAASQDVTTGQVYVGAEIEFDEQQVNRALLDLLKITDRYGLRLPREFGLLFKSFLLFDRYVDALAPDMEMFRDNRVLLGESSWNGKDSGSQRYRPSGNPTANPGFGDGKNIW